MWSRTLWLLLCTLTLGLLSELRAEGAPLLPTEPQLGAVTMRLVGRSTAERPRFHYLTLGSSERLQLTFDLIAGQGSRLCYRIRHYDADWSPSSLLPVEYLSGFDGAELELPMPSSGTLVPYDHYTLTLPNEQTQLKRSGNYRITIYDPTSPEVALLEVPFAVVSPTLSLSASVSGEAWQDYQGKRQEIDLQVQAPSGLSTRLDQELHIVVLQNARWDNAVTLTAPSSYLQGRLSYEGPQGALFLGGNIYAKLEHLSDRIRGLGVVDSHPTDEGYQLMLYPQRNRSLLPYSSEQSFQGIQIIRSDMSSTPETEGDYHWVTFTLESPRLEGGQVVLEGEAFRYHSLEERTLRYDEATRSYTTTLPLKVGYQEYQYLFLPEGSSTLLSAPTVGDHWETKNYYTLLAYYRSPSDRADQLLGVLEF